MSDAEIIQKLSTSLRSATASLASAEKWLSVLAGEEGVEINPLKGEIKYSASVRVEEAEDDDSQVIEGVFDGQNMLGSDESLYPVPANYASKSKLVEGDQLKLTIQPNGAFIYKQIEQIERQLVTGKLILEGSQYQVLADDGKVYKVLYASVTFFRAQVGNTVTIILPAGQEATWGAIENVLPVTQV